MSDMSDKYWNNMELDIYVQLRLNQTIRSLEYASKVAQMYLDPSKVEGQYDTEEFKQMAKKFLKHASVFSTYQAVLLELDPVIWVFVPSYKRNVAVNYSGLEDVRQKNSLENADIKWWPVNFTTYREATEFCKSQYRNILERYEKKEVAEVYKQMQTTTH